MEKSLKEMERRIVRSFLDVAVMCILKGSGGLNGHEILMHIHEKLGILLPPGTIYSTLYALEREQLVTGTMHSKSRTYKLTSKGQAKLREVDKMAQAFNLFMTQLCGYKMEQLTYSTVTL
jgi:DNA-binding PadR family transcriptional regulator